jgi:hypothetical protein
MFSIIRPAGRFREGRPLLASSSLINARLRFQFPLAVRKMLKTSGFGNKFPLVAFLQHDGRRGGQPSECAISNKRHWNHCQIREVSL